MVWERPPLSELKQSLADPNHAIGMRMRAAYYLRQLHTDGDAATRSKVVSILTQQLQNPSHGSLMRHEFAYVLGQLQDTSAVPVLIKVLSNDQDCVMVRHEAAEAIGAIGDVSAKNSLESIIGNPHIHDIELVDTCRLAQRMMEWRLNPDEDDTTMPVGCACMMNPYSSVDPAPPHPAHEKLSTEELGEILRDASLDLFERYRAMFSLRNRGDVTELCKTLVTDDSSALLRHEVAYVLGQLQNVESIPALRESLQRSSEHFMVRHESAEALGAMEDQWEIVESILKEFSKDDDIVVRESCLVAIDAADYWGTSHQQPTNEEVERSSFAKEKANLHFNVQV